MSKPAHKQDDPAKAPGQVVNDITLGDYITRKNYHEAFNKVAEEKGLKKKKMTFEEWWRTHYKEWLNYEDYSNLQDDLARTVWKAAQENV